MDSLATQHTGCVYKIIKYAWIVEAVQSIFQIAKLMILTIFVHTKNSQGASLKAMNYTPGLLG